MRWAPSHHVLSACPHIQHAMGTTPHRASYLGLLHHLLSIFILLLQKGWAINKSRTSENWCLTEKQRWRRWERLIKNVMIPFAETELLITAQQQACDSHHRWRLILGYGWRGGPQWALRKDMLTGELGVCQRGVSLWLVLHTRPCLHQMKELFPPKPVWLSG